MERIVMIVITAFVIISKLNESSWKDQGSFVQLAMKSTPMNFALHIDMGDYYIEKRQLYEAIKCYISATNISAKDETKVIAHERLGEIYAQNKSFNKARQEFNAILTIDPDNSSARNGLGNIAWLTGDLTTAKMQYEQALKFNSENIKARKNLEAVNRLLSNKHSQE